MSTIESLVIVIYIAGVVFNIAYFHYFWGKDRYENKELDEDAGFFETLFFGLFCLGLAGIEILGNMMLCFGSWITSVFYACWLIHFLYFTDEGKYRREYHKYLKQIVSSLTDWNRYLCFDDGLGLVSACSIASSWHSWRMVLPSSSYTCSASSGMASRVG